MGNRYAIIIPKPAWEFNSAPYPVHRQQREHPLELRKHNVPVGRHYHEHT